MSMPAGGTPCVTLTCELPLRGHMHRVGPTTYTFSESEEEGGVA